MLGGRILGATILVGLSAVLAPALARAGDNRCPDQHSSAIVCIGWEYYMCECAEGIREFIGGCPVRCIQVSRGNYVGTRYQACNIALSLAPSPPDCPSGCEESGYEENGVLFEKGGEKCCEGIKTRKCRTTPCAQSSNQ